MRYDESDTRNLVNMHYEINENDMKNLVECVEDMSIYNFELNRYNMKYCYAPISKMKTVNLDSFYFECKEFLINLGYSVTVESYSYNIHKVLISTSKYNIEYFSVDEKLALFIAAYDTIKKL